MPCLSGAAAHCLHSPPGTFWGIQGTQWTHTGVCHSRCVSQDSLQESVLFFLHVDCGDQTQVARLGGKHLYPQSHLSGPSCVFEDTFGQAGGQHLTHCQNVRMTARRADGVSVLSLISGEAKWSVTWRLLLRELVGHGAALAFQRLTIGRMDGTITGNSALTTPEAT